MVFFLNLASCGSFPTYGTVHTIVASLIESIPMM